MQTDSNMDLPLIIHDDIFHKFFRPYRHPQAKYDVWDGYGLETYGSDLEIVKNLSDAFIWTVLDHWESGGNIIVTGKQFVNRSCYIPTRRPHNGRRIEIHCNSLLAVLPSFEFENQMTTLQSKFVSKKM